MNFFFDYIKIKRNISNNIYKFVGVAHGDELGYEFYSNYLKNLPNPGSPEEKITRIITKLWTNFAKDG